MSTQTVSRETTTTPRPPEDSIADRRNARLTLIFTIVLALLILIPSMLGFITKFIELFAVLTGDPDGVFALTPILNYLLASLGFFCLLLWAAGRGMFHDVELPKRAMLEREDLLDGRTSPTAPKA